MKREWFPEYDDMTKKALEMRNFSHTPYSHFNVGAALMTEDGSVYTGCNIELASYAGTVCAERTALVKAISEGHKHFRYIVIVGGREDKPGTDICPPCGICRQFMREFCEKDEFLVILPEVSGDGKVTDYEIMTLEELMPVSFGPEHL